MAAMLRRRGKGSTWDQKKRFGHWAWRRAPTSRRPCLLRLGNDAPEGVEVEQGPTHLLDLLLVRLGDAHRLAHLEKGILVCDRGSQCPVPAVAEQRVGRGARGRESKERRPLRLVDMTFFPRTGCCSTRSKSSEGFLALIVGSGSPYQ